MFGWLRKRRASPGRVPEEAQQYMAALRPLMDDPYVRGHFHQVTCLSLAVPGHAPVDFFALEFRSGPAAALIWVDGQGNWGAGRWLPLPRPDADIAQASPPLALDYFQGAQASPSLEAAIRALAASKPD